ncbi:hypothetical protein EVAR_22468_1 [Eumeta japonica]|uniref:Uncharacterized protein n=1 Tax=Eumeta variegata TaxID=151549 RepID=A0A4C1VC26_EUMVA|nr:hypothetical protein EVAR_22468_1 [Eumeta japonica]
MNGWNISDKQCRQMMLGLLAKTLPTRQLITHNWPGRPCSALSGRWHAHIKYACGSARVDIFIPTFFIFIDLAISPDPDLVFDSDSSIIRNCDAGYTLDIGPCPALNSYSVTDHSTNLNDAMGKCYKQKFRYRSYHRFVDKMSNITEPKLGAQKPRPVDDTGGTLGLARRRRSSQSALTTAALING